jgi:coenzyme F420-reducing hydrogenase gamma subunit
MLCRAAMAHDMERLRELRRAAEMIVAVPGPCATLYVTVPRPKER